MGASKDIRRYPVVWLSLFDQFQEDPTKEITVECGSVKEAEKFRLEFYKAREAQKREDAANTDKRTCYPNLDRKEARIVGTNCVFGYKDTNRIADLINKTLSKLNEQGDTP